MEVLITVLLAALIVMALRHGQRGGRRAIDVSGEPVAPKLTRVEAESSRARREGAPGPKEELLKVCAPLIELADSLDAEELRRHKVFLGAVDKLSRAPASQLLGCLDEESHSVIDSAVLTALHRVATAEDVDALIDRLHLLDARAGGQALSLLVELAETPIVVKVLMATARHWLGSYDHRKALKRFLKIMLERGEIPHLDADADRQLSDADVLRTISQLVGEVSHAGADALRRELARLEQAQFLDTIGRLLPPAPLPDEPVSTAEMESLKDGALDALLSSPGRSVLLTGPAGVGKTALGNMIVRSLAQRGWRVFSAEAQDIIANMKHLGELEQRLLDVAEALRSSTPIVWRIQDLIPFLTAGSHEHDPTGVLPKLLPALVAGKYLLLAEIRRESLDAVFRSAPRLEPLFRIIRLEEPSAADMLQLAHDWAAGRDPAVWPAIPDALIQEGQRYAAQLCGQRALPGQLLDLLASAQEVALERDQPVAALQHDDLLGALSRLTGLSRDMLDERRSLNLDELRELFRHRVIGQPEAVECLIERIALYKAGLTDPTRPTGVFLFAGPSGTGKTEIAKTLAEFLFGTPERLLRLDMSEFKTHEDLGRLLGTGGDSLLDRIRAQPFSVVLLDEFEKAHPETWSLFLQVFDDGRLSDRSGRLADFRNAIIILTSNLGATQPTGAGMGFSGTVAAFSTALVERAITETFSREFINRLDRVVIFRPLDRHAMRLILLKELDAALARRGLRRRDWAIEWEDGVIEFLLEEGFTVDLGARPLKRAIERHLLTPLALAIVERRAPEGGQFLLIHRDGQRLRVEFIDPDTPAVALQSTAPPQTDEADDLRSLVLEGSSRPEEIERLASVHRKLAETVAGAGWTARKEDAFARLNASGFWEDLGRFTVLGRIELLDRIETSLESAGSLLTRLTLTGANRPSLPPQTAQRLAQQLFLLQAAVATVEENAPSDAFILIQACHPALREAQRLVMFQDQLARMYHAWAQRRGMRLTKLDVPDEAARDGQRTLLAISGFGAHRLLLPEAGYHVLEVPLPNGQFKRLSLRVRVAPQPEAPAAGHRELVAQACASLELDKSSPAVVRRYRERPTPLVRDEVHGWRSGRIDRVWDGEFDVMS